MENKKSAIVFFADKLLRLQLNLRLKLISLEDYEVNFYGVFNQAKQMEKEQIIDAHLEGWGDAYDYLKNESSDARQAEDYYNETYGK